MNEAIKALESNTQHFHKVKDHKYKIKTLFVASYVIDYLESVCTDKMVSEGVVSYSFKDGSMVLVSGQIWFEAMGE